MSKSIKDQTTRAFQVGGYNPPSVPQQPYAQPTQINPQTGTYTLPGTGHCWLSNSGWWTNRLYTLRWSNAIFSTCTVYWSSVSNVITNN